MRQIARPDCRVGIALSQVEANENIIAGNRFGRIGFVEIRGHAVRKHIHLAKPQLHFCWLDRDAGIAGGGDHTSPVSVAAVKCGLAQWRIRNCFGTRTASASSRAPVIFSSTNLVTPSPSRTSRFAKFTQTWVSDSVNSFSSSEFLNSYPDAPFARYKYRVVRAHVAVDADAIETLVDRRAQRLIE